MCFTFPNYSFIMSNVTTFTALIFVVVASWTYFFKNEVPLELILKKSCMPKTKSRSDLEIIYSYAKNTIGAT
jgi:hypothetical protein